MKGLHLFAIFSVLLTACGEGTRTGNPVASTNVVVTASAQPAVIASVWNTWLKYFVGQAYALIPSDLRDSNNAQVSLSSAWVSIKDVEFKVDESDDSVSGESDIRFKGPYEVDLLSTSPTAIDQQLVTSQSYKRVQMKLDPAKTPSASAPAGLSGNSIYFMGAIGGSSFSFSSKENSEFAIAGSKGVASDGVHDLLIVIRFADLFKRIDLSSIHGTTQISDSSKVSTASSACPEIDSSARDLYTCFRKGLESTANFGKDQSGAHDLGSSDEKVRD